MVHYQRVKAEKQLMDAFQQNIQDPDLMLLERNMAKQYLKLF